MSQRPLPSPLSIFLYACVPMLALWGCDADRAGSGSQTSAVVSCGAKTCGAFQLCCGAKCTSILTATDCGGCGVKCATAHQTSVSCAQLDAVTYACQYACAAGFADCNTTPPDTGGCATNVNTDPDNCGDCGVVCPTPQNGVATCSAGVCGITCNTAYSACGSACIAKSDPDNCNACGKTCTAQQVCATKTGGTTWSCQSDPCPMGTESCNRSCVDITGDTGNCGGCGNACAAPAAGTGSATCTKGACGIACAAPTPNPCVGGCADFSSDPANCGACGNACRNGDSCQAGQCVASCVNGATSCSGACVNLQTSSGNCGACGRPCADAQVCSAGLCCGSGLSNCQSTCVNLQSDPDNCGACANACAQGMSCSSGACVAPCAGAQIPCGAPTRCVDPLYDPANCGRCGNTCALPNATPGCLAGACYVAACASGHRDCNGWPGDGCETDVLDDPANCGACGNVCRVEGGTGECTNGMCGLVLACDAGYTLCGQNLGPPCFTAADCARGLLCTVQGCVSQITTPACADLQSDPANCGGCGVTCAAGLVCANGACASPCGPPLGQCGGACVDLQRDPQNCGACNNACVLSNATASCAAGMCGVASCTADHADCDGLAADGCEVSTQSDAQNCGGCARACSAGAACDGGSCCVAAFSSAAYPAGPWGPRSIAAADFNADGRLDLAIVNEIDGNVYVLLGRGDGTYLPATSYVAGYYGMISVAAADFDGDGTADLVVGSDNDEPMFVLLNHGDGSFGKPQSYGPQKPSFAIVTGDWNGDGAPDFASADIGNASVDVYLNNNNRTGTFAAPVSYALGAGVAPLALAAGDLDGDGNLDLVTANNVGSVSVLFNLGGKTGTFTIGGTYPLGANATAIAMADLDGVGQLDLAVAVDQSLAVFLNPGRTALAAGVRYALRTPAYVLATGDWNGDGRVDLAFPGFDGDNNPGFDLLLNLGAGAFGAPLLYPTASTTVALCAADLNGDGKTDLALSVNVDPGTVTVFLDDAPACGCSDGRAACSGRCLDLQVDAANCGACGNACALANATSGCAAGACAIAACNPGYTDCDGTPANGCETHTQVDILNCGSCGRVCSSATAVCAGGDCCNATFAPAVTDMLLQGNPTNFAITDFDHDGWPDVALGDITGTVGVLWAPGKPTPATETIVYTALSHFEITGIATGNFNADPNPDLVVANYNKVQILLGGGNGTFTSGTSFTAGTVYTAIVAADFDGDGLSDFAVNDQVGQDVGVYLNKGGGSFALVPYAAPIDETSTLTAADLNGDGLPDLIAANLGVGLSVLLSTGAPGSFAPATFYAVDTRSPVAAADFNGDGKLNLAVLTLESSVQLFLNTGKGSLSHTGSYAVGVNTNFLAAADWNGDGLPDLAFDSGSETFSFALNRGGANFATATTYALTVQPYVVAAGDLNGDGRPDLILPSSLQAEVILDDAPHLQLSTALAHRTAIDARRPTRLPRRRAVAVAVGPYCTTTSTA